MNWMEFVLAIVLGSCVTSALIWAQQRAYPQWSSDGYFARVAMSVVATALIAGLVRMAMGSGQSDNVVAAGGLFASGWLLGGLVAAWFLRGRALR